MIYGLVCMVPTAPFSIFGGVFDISAGMVPLTYLVGFVAMLFTALSYQQMSQAFPVAGSVYAYVGRGLSSGMGFLAGWAILLDYLLVPTLLYVVGANAMHTVLPAVPQPAWIAFFVVLNTVVNLRGIETTARANRFPACAVAGVGGVRGAGDAGDPARRQWGALELAPAV